jgi:hypothetical protein
MAKGGEFRILMMASPEPNEAPAEEPTSTEEADESELSLDDLDDVAGGMARREK